MTPDVVVDVGNTRMKWGRCVGGLVRHTVALSGDTPDAWLRQYAEWGLTAASRWAVSGVSPGRVEALVRWLAGRAAPPLILRSHQQLPLAVTVNDPAGVGIDRLLNAVAASRREERRRLPAVVADVGTAVTVDLIDADGAFRGGSIFPGLRLMAQALCDHTALLPFVAPAEAAPDLPGLNTRQAIRAGVYYAVAGGINALVGQLARVAGGAVHLYLTGGDAEAIAGAVDGASELWPEMTLEGLRLSAEALP